MARRILFAVDKLLNHLIESHKSADGIETEAPSLEDEMKEKQQDDRDDIAYEVGELRGRLDALEEQLREHINERRESIHFWIGVVISLATLAAMIAGLIITFMR